MDNDLSARIFMPTEHAVSTNPGKEVATFFVSVIRIGPSAEIAPTAKAIATR
jgi:hypothetical protein